MAFISVSFFRVIILVVPTFLGAIVGVALTNDIIRHEVGDITRHEVEGYVGIGSFWHEDGFLASLRSAEFADAVAKEASMGLSAEELLPKRVGGKGFVRYHLAGPTVLNITANGRSFEESVRIVDTVSKVVLKRQNLDYDKAVEIFRKVAAQMKGANISNSLGNLHSNSLGNLQLADMLVSEVPSFGRPELLSSPLPIYTLIQSRAAVVLTLASLGFCFGLFLLLIVGKQKV